MSGPSPATICQMYVDRINDPELDLKAKEYIVIVFEGRDIPCFVGLALVSERLLREGHSLEEVPILDEVPPAELLIDWYNRIGEFDEIEYSLLKHIEREYRRIVVDARSIECSDEVELYCSNRRCSKKPENGVWQVRNNR